MAETVAAIRLTLKDRGFRRTFDRAADGVKRGARAMGQAIKSQLSTGARGGLDALKQLGSRLKGVGGMVGGIVGGVGFAELVRGAVEADDRFRKLGFTMRAGEGVFQSYADIQRHAEAQALKWARSSTDLADALETVFDTTGNAQFAKDTLEEIAKAASASGMSVQSIAPIVAEMNRQFGVTSQQVPEALASVLDLGRRGGLSVEEIGANLGKLGKTAGVAGLQGEQGLRVLLAMANQISAASGNAEGSVERLQLIFNTLKGNTDRLKLLDIDPAGKDALTLLSEVVTKTKGDPGQLGKVFGEQGVAVAQAFGGFENLAEAMKKAAKTTTTASDIERKAAENVRGPSGGIKVAIEKLEQAFRKPRMITAINKLTDKLPALADALAELVDFITDNPWTSAGVLAGATFGKGALGAVLSGAVGAGAGGAGAGAGAAGVAGAAGAAGAGALRTLKGGVAASAPFAVMAAIDQAMKLSDEIGGLDKLPEAINRAADDTEKQRAIQLKVAEDQGFDQAKVTEAGFFGDSTKFIRRGKDGQIEASDVSKLSSSTNLADLAKRIASEAAQAAKGQAALKGPADVTFGDQRIEGSAPQKPVKIDPESQAASARAMADQIRQSELRVRVLNPDQIGAAVGDRVNSGGEGGGNGAKPRRGSST